mgnify:CR=1 FL=1
MEYIDIHARMVMRTADDYARMALSGCVAVMEPSGWPGWTRRTLAIFEDAFRRLTDFEPRRAAGHGIRHFAWLGVSPQEAEDRELVLALLARLPGYLEQPTVLGVGGVGLERITRNEVRTLRDHIDLAIDHEQLLMIHSPRLEDKYRGTRCIIDMLGSDDRVEPNCVLIDHAEEHTVGMILGNGYWAGLTIEPRTGLSPERAADIIERFGPERICVGSVCDGERGEPTAIPRFALEMRRRGHDLDLIRRVVYRNPATFARRSPHFDTTVPLPAGVAARVAARAHSGAEPVVAGNVD